jgi:hypothetical protein
MLAAQRIDWHYSSGTPFAKRATSATWRGLGSWELQHAAQNGCTATITLDRLFASTVGDNELTDTSIFRETRIQKSEHQKTIATPLTA